MFEDIVVNDDVTAPAGCNQMVRRVLREFDLDIVLESLKRNQGVSMYDLTACMVTHAMQMRGLSINRMEDILEEPEMQEVYGLDRGIDKNDLYRASEKLGMNMEVIVDRLTTVLKKKFGMSFDEVFFDWSATYIDGEPTDFIRFGHSKDHRSDRPQVNVGMVMDSNKRMAIGLTVVPGNMDDKTHFPKLFRTVKRFLNPGCLIVFDNGAYSDTNGKLVRESGFDYLTRAKWTSSDDKHITEVAEWKVMPQRGIDGTVTTPEEGERDYVRKYRGNSGTVKILVFSEKKYEADMMSYRRKAERDFDEAMELSSSIRNGKPRKKYRNANWFVDVKQSYVFNLETMNDRKAAVEAAVQTRITGHEGYFILTCSRDIDPCEALRIYRSRNHIEDAYRDLKTGIDLRPLRCRSRDGIKGRILISFLALFVISFIRHIVPEASTLRAETMISELNRFSVTVRGSKNGGKRLEYSGFTPFIRMLMRAFGSLSERYIPPYVPQTPLPEGVLRPIIDN